MKRSGSAEPVNKDGNKLIQRAKSHRYAGAFVEEVDMESEITEQKADDDDDEDSDNEHEAEAQGKDNEVKDTHNKFHDIDVLNSLLMIENLVEWNFSVNNKKP